MSTTFTRLALATTAFALVLGFGPGPASLMHQAAASRDGGADAHETADSPDPASHDHDGARDHGDCHDRADRR